jgi:hypothetical protein
VFLSRYSNSHGAHIAQELMAAPDSEGHTPLEWAADSGDVNITEFFMRKGMSPFRRDAMNRTALFWAVKVSLCCRYINVLVLSVYGERALVEHRSGGSGKTPVTYFLRQRWARRVLCVCEIVVSSALSSLCLSQFEEYTELAVDNTRTMCYVVVFALRLVKELPVVT